PISAIGLRMVAAANLVEVAALVGDTGISTVGTPSLLISIWKTGELVSVYPADGRTESITNRGVLIERSPSTHFNVQVLHNAAPICHLIPDESIEIICAVLVRLYVELRVTRAHLRRSERLVETGIELVHDRFRRAVADKDAVPVQRLKTWKRIGNRRNIRQPGE